METIGFSTGSIDKSDVCKALGILRQHEIGAIELSALRMHELFPLVSAIPTFQLDAYRHIAVHAPSSYGEHEEKSVADALFSFANKGWFVILHPDTIHDCSLWLRFEDRICIENMDRRKSTGRTVEELKAVFGQLPRASFCFDVAHARQYDTSMTESYRLLEEFGTRLKQVHISELDSDSRHVRLTRSGIRACREIAGLIPSGIPAIIEAPVEVNQIEEELDASLEALGRFATAPCRS